MTYKQIREHVSRTLGMQLDTSAPEGDLIRDWILAGTIDIAARTRAGVRAVDLIITPNTPVHDMSQQIISLLDIEDSAGFLKRYSREDAAFMQAIGQRGYAYEEPLLWLSPLRDREGQTVRAYGVFMPQEMDEDTDSPSQPDFGNLSPQFHPAIVVYCLWKGGEYIEHEQSGGRPALEGAVRGPGRERWRDREDQEDPHQARLSGGQPQAQPDGADRRGLRLAGVPRRMKPTSILPLVKGMTRDYAVDSLPSGYVWDMKDFIPQRRGTRMESRSAWQYFTPNFGVTLWGGYHARFAKAERLYWLAAPPAGATAIVNYIDPLSGAITVGIDSGLASMRQNGVMLRERVYFFDHTETVLPIWISYDGVTQTNGSIHASAPKAPVGVAYKDRLVLGFGSDIYFSPLETAGGPLGAWDAISKIGVSKTVSGFAAMPGKLLIFHPSRISRLIGQLAPETDVDSDMYVDTLTDQVGCTIPQTIVYWNENVCFADERGIYMTDGASVRNLTEQGGIGDFWRDIFAARAPFPSVSAGIYFDYLIVSVLGATGQNWLLLCDLNTKAWFRFTNFAAQAMVPSEGSFEENWAGLVGGRLSKISDMFAGTTLADPSVELYVGPTNDQVDGNALPVLAEVQTGWNRLGDEARKQIRFVFLSYRHQSYEHPDLDDAIEVHFRKDPATTTDLGAYVKLGEMGTVTEYTRKRLPVLGKHYGVQFWIRAKRPSRFFNISDIGVGAQMNDRGKVMVGSD